MEVLCRTVAPEVEINRMVVCIQGRLREANANIRRAIGQIVSARRRSDEIKRPVPVEGFHRRKKDGRS